MNAIGAFGGILGHHVAHVIDDIRVIPRAADQRIGPQTAIQKIVATIGIEHVGSTVADQTVIRSVAGGIDRRRPRQGDVLDIGKRGEREGDARLHRICALVGALSDHVSRIVHHVDVVARSTKQGIGARTAVEYVVARVAGEGVGRAIARQGIVQLVACAGEAGTAGQNQIFDVAAEGVIDARVDRIDTFARILRDHIADIVHQVRVIARAAGHRIGAGRSIEGVVVAVPGQGVVRRIAGGVDIVRAGQCEIFDVRREGIGHRALHSVDATARLLDDAVRPVIHDVGVIPAIAD